jgi:hypothetical protein
MVQGLFFGSLTEGCFFFPLTCGRVWLFTCLEDQNMYWSRGTYFKIFFILFNFKNCTFLWLGMGHVSFNDIFKKRIEDANYAISERQVVGEAKIVESKIIFTTYGRFHLVKQMELGS